MSEPQSASIRYTTSNEGISPGMIDGFFVGWPSPPSAEKLIEVTAGSYRRVWALDGDRVVGYINAISDGVLNAFIPWLEVHLDYQGRGIGRELVKRIIAELDGMYAIDLCCDEHLVPFYEKLGFIGCAGAARRNRAALADPRL